MSNETMHGEGIKVHDITRDHEQDMKGEIPSFPPQAQASGSTLITVSPYGRKASLGDTEGFFLTNDVVLR
ncbi:hypothetical protein MHYP_G00290890 [Metynnis hypsauchen]